jgi:hypothetical protein
MRHLTAVTTAVVGVVSLASAAQAADPRIAARLASPPAAPVVAQPVVSQPSVIALPALPLAPLAGRDLVLVSGASVEMGLRKGGSPKLSGYVGTTHGGLGGFTWATFPYPLPVGEELTLTLGGKAVPLVHGFFSMKEALASGTLVTAKVANESVKGQLTSQPPIIASVTVGSAIVITSALTPGASGDDRLIAWQGGQPPYVINVCGVPAGSQTATQVLYTRDAVMSNTLNVPAATLAGNWERYVVAVRYETPFAATSGQLPADRPMMLGVTSWQYANK